MIDLEPLDAVVVELVRTAQDSRASASQIMRAHFRTVALKPHQQKRIKERFHSVLASSAMIDEAIARATPGGSVVEALEAPVRVLISRVLAGDLSPKVAGTILPWIDWERVATLPEEVQEIEDPLRRAQLIGSLPDWLVRRIARALGDEAQACAEGLTGRAPLTLRANTLRCTREELAARLLEDGIETRPTRWARDGVEVLGAAQLFRTTAFHHGWFEMQDEASQLVAEIVAPPPGGLVVDACAGAGGKTLAIAGAMQGRGGIVALDTSSSRLSELRRRARRAGVQNLRVIRVDKESWSDEVEQLVRSADRILIDAPCSGIGSLRRNPDMRDRLNEAEIVRLQEIQEDLLSRAAALLAPHARVVYATCTILRDENDDVVDRVRAHFPELEPVRVVEILGGERARSICNESGTAMQTYPHRHGCDGFFTAVLRRPKRPIASRKNCT